MSNFSGPADIYRELVENVPEDEEWLLGLVAFAIVEEQKMEWTKHFEKNNGRPPSYEEIESWYLQQPQGVLLRAKDTAKARLTDYAQNAITVYMEEFKTETLEGILVEEIRETKKFWPQFGVNLAGGFVSSLLFAILLTTLAFLLFNDSSPMSIGSNIGNHDGEIENEQKN
jgi:hypothetical protein